MSKELELNQEQRAALLLNRREKAIKDGRIKDAISFSFIAGLIYMNGLDKPSLAVQVFNETYRRALEVRDFRRCGEVLKNLAIIMERDGSSVTSQMLKKQAKEMVINGGNR